METVYQLMNKDRMVASFIPRSKGEFTTNIRFEIIESKNTELPIGFEDINVWLDNRKSSKHNEHLKKIMRDLGCDDNEQYMRLTHACSINDTFWVKKSDEKCGWKDVSLYSNQFSEVISKLAFEGVGLCDQAFSSSTPELSAEGSFRKCFRKEEIVGKYGSDIFIYKRGKDEGKGLEPYCEAMASELAAVVSDNVVPYEITMLHDKLASKCNLFTDEKHGFASFSKLMANKRGLDLQDVVDYFDNINESERFREMLVIDALCFNTDRHYGNFGVMFDTETLKIIKLSPIFDMNLSLFPSMPQAPIDIIYTMIGNLTPKLGDDFTTIGHIALTPKLKDRVKNVKDFKFTFRGDDNFPLERVEIIEAVVQKQAEAILKDEVLKTQDVFFPQYKTEKQRERQMQQEAFDNAILLYNSFKERLKTDNFDDVATKSCCIDGIVQFYIESSDGKDEAVIDFVKKSIEITGNGKFYSLSDVVQADNNFGTAVQTITSRLSECLADFGMSEKVEDWLFSKTEAGHDNSLSVIFTKKK